jgi:hypothetical protein
MEYQTLLQQPDYLQLALAGVGGAVALMFLAGWVGMEDSPQAVAVAVEQPILERNLEQEGMAQMALQLLLHISNYGQPLRNYR